jgi:hypothetical protein
MNDVCVGVHGSSFLFCFELDFGLASLAIDYVRAQLVYRILEIVSSIGAPFEDGVTALE